MLKEPHSGTCRDGSCHFKHHARGNDFLQVVQGRTEALNDSTIIASDGVVVCAHHRVCVIGHGNVTILLWDDAQGYAWNDDPRVKIIRFPKINYR